MLENEERHKKQFKCKTLSNFRVAAIHQNLCLDDLQQDNEKPYNVGVYTCHRPNVTRSQFFSFTKAGVLRNELSCASVQQRYIYFI